MSDYVQKTIAAYDLSSDKYHDSTKDMTPSVEFGRFIKMVGGSGKSILDAGCAFGRDTAAFDKAGLAATGIDLSGELLKKAQQLYPNLTFRKMDIRTLDFDDVNFDGIWCHAVLLHLNDADITKALSEFYRVLRPGGALFVSFKKGQGSHEVMENFSSNAARFYNFKTIESVSKTLLDAGFENVDAYYVNERDLFGPDKRDLDWVHCFSTKL